MHKIFLNLVIFAFYSFKLIDCTQVISDDRFLEECLFAHNKYRGLHENTPPLRLHQNVSDYAMERVMRLAKIQMNLRNPMTDKKVVFGENFFWYYDTAGYHSCEDAVNVWYNGIKKYNYNRPGFSESTGGFSQIVWRGSQYLGCALAESDVNPSYPETYIVCNYYPAGNIDNQYPYNVYPVKDKPSAGSAPSAGSGSASGSVSGSVSNEWSGNRPGNRPEEKPGGNRPGTGSSTIGDRPGSSSHSDVGIWTIPSRPGTAQRPQNSRPPTAPTYPLTLLHSLF